MTKHASMTWWGVAGVELRFGDRSLLIDPYLHPLEARADYICITHEDYDHCHEPTLERLVAGPRFQMLIIPRSCTYRTKLDSPVHDSATELEFVPSDKLVVMYPKYKRDPEMEYVGPTEMSLDGFHIETIDSSERPERYRPGPGSVWPDGTGHYVGGGEFPQLGYVITESSTGLTFYHPGDLHEAFDSQRELRGRVDYMFFPSVKLEGVELSVIDNVRPRHLVPIHHRMETPDFPIPVPTAINEDELVATDLGHGMPHPGADPKEYRREIHAMFNAHWYPTPRPPLQRIVSLEPQFRELGCELLIIEAGKPHQLVAEGRTELLSD
jgi:L-ascorbate metabolism protein UlaG (beta-lactamase superfamily)